MTLSRSAAVVSLVGALLLLIGSVTPWVTAGPLTKNGIEGDGVITLVLALLAGGFAGATFSPPAVARVMRWFPLPFGLLALLVAIIDVADVSGEGYGISVGWGLWLTLIASIILVIGAVGLAFAPMPKPPAPQNAQPFYPQAHYSTGQYPSAQYPPQAFHPPAQPQHPQGPGQTPPPPPPGA